MVCILRSLLVLREYVLMLLTSTIKTYFDNIINFVRHFLNSSTDTQS